MSRCKSCNAEIIWIKTAAGRSMPCDAERVQFDPDTGNETFITPGGNVVKGSLLKKGHSGRNGFLYGYVPHWATCPNADRHRRGR